ncbi:hypothetical protein IWZ03DRAFT_102331 [Phyllosticta citriasiana]|uniref:Uncharacterized protein n=1 Tax=Phyllosticta citriasiana TaxID=595635 RepID=A0ABR1KWK1_9PEZI
MWRSSGKDDERPVVLRLFYHVIFFYLSAITKSPQTPLCRLSLGSSFHLGVLRVERKEELLFHHFFPFDRKRAKKKKKKKKHRSQIFDDLFVNNNVLNCSHYYDYDYVLGSNTPSPCLVLLLARALHTCRVEVVSWCGVVKRQRERKTTKEKKVIEMTKLLRKGRRNKDAQ